MSTITTRAGKGSPLTNTELDDNFSNLNTDKLEASDLVASDTSYDNTESGLLASNVKSAIDELNDIKLNITDLAANVVFYPTDTASDISTYYTLVDSTGDANYDTTAVNISTGTITADDQFIAALASSAGVLEGSTGTISVQTVGNVRKTAGEKTGTFYFKVYHRNSGGTETLIGTSGVTGIVDSATYEQFFAEALISSTAFTATDRVVIKYYANQTGTGTDATFSFQFGGTEPVRTNFPVPVSVVPHVNDAADINVDTTAFNGLLSGTDDDVQAALNTLDDHGHAIADVTGLQTALDGKQPYDADTAKLDVAQTFTAQQTFGEIKEGVYSLTGTEINPANGTIQYKTLSANTTFTEALEDGQAVVLMLAGGSTYTVTYPTLTWVSGTGNSAPTLTANDSFCFWKVASTLYAAYLGSYA